MLKNFARDVLDVLFVISIGCAVMWALEMGVRADRPHPTTFNHEVCQ